ncbi:glycosyltransferase [Sphingobacterium hotanense]|uniref:glycosyltransferase n=1 Tax=Sphingobacterium hotanense TaxID=649196 RepID=UPI0011F15DD0|nr:glycosyltransferase [Sphingobacterium hotanense]
MKAVFINDHRFVHSNADSKVYTTGTLDSDFWIRYTVFFDHLTVVGRGTVVDGQYSNENLSSAPDVYFHLLFDIKGGKDYFLKEKYIFNQLYSIIKSADFVVIRVPSSIGNIAAQVCLKLGKKYLVEVVGCILDVSNTYGNPLMKLIGRLSYYRMRKTVKHSEGAIYVTERFLQKRYPTQKPSISASNVRLSTGNPLVLTDRCSRLRACHQHITIGTIGSVDLKYKGHHVLFYAASLLKRNGFNFTIKIVGGGNPDNLKQLAEKLEILNNIEFLGKVAKGDQIFHFLDKIDLYVHPSLTEGLPRAVIEAMSRGCPILASNAGGLPELISEDFVHNVGDYHTLSEQLMRMVDSPNIMYEQATINFEKSKEFDCEVLDQRRNMYINKLLKNI